MSVTIDGSLGITTPSETSTGPIVAPTIGASSGSNLSLQSNGVTNATLDTNGNFGLGVTPSAWTSSWKVIQISSKSSFCQAGGGDALVGSNFYQATSGPLYLTSSYATAYSQNAGNGQHIWLTAPSGTAGNPVSFTQAMTLDNSGNLLVGYTSLPANSNSLAVNGFAFINRTTLVSGNNSALNISANDGSYYGIMIQNISASNTFFEVFINSTGSPAGSIQQTSSTTVAYNTTSDQRLKTDLGLASQSRILDLKIHDYECKVDGSKARGVFAQEAFKVIPEAVTVGSDEINDDGTKDKPWAVDYSKFVPDLIVMVQEQQEMINQLKAEIAELKGAK